MTTIQNIRIDDLADPVLTDIQKAALAQAESAPVDLSVESVLSAAVERTAFEDFGPDDFRERLALWLSEVDEDPDRTGLGRALHWEGCVTYASTRLRIHDLLQRHPEIHDIRIERPIIVVGLPRSGTTHLVNLIAADQRLRSLPMWESQEPVPDARESIGGDGLDPRYRRSQESWEQMRFASPLMAAMHPMAPDHIHEELELLCPDFTSYRNEWVARVPRWRDYYLAHDQTRHYEYLKTALKILQWYRPRERWVLKSPQHLEQLGPLMSAFPDAIIVGTHRDPVSVIQSAATMVTYAARMNYHTLDPGWYLQYWADRIRTLLESSIRDQHLVPSHHSIDLLFHDFMADEMGTVERVYELAGLTMTPEARRQIQGHIDANPRGKEGQILYDLRKDFGADPAEVRAPFGFYLDRFAIREEVD